MRRAVLPAIAALVLLVAAMPATAGQTTYVDKTTDYFIVVPEPQVFTATTDLCDDSDELWCWSIGYFTDSMLWLYDQNGLLIALNDDDGVSYASRMVIQLEPGTYRLRAGRCCGNPEAAFPSNGHYYLMTSLDAILDPNPPQLSPVPIPSELPTPTPTPTEVPSDSPTPEPTPDPTLPPSPSVEPTVAPTPEPSPSPTPSPEPSPTPSPVEPTLPPTPAPTPPPPAPSPTESPSPTPEPPPSPTEPPPSVEPTPPPTEPPPPDPVALAGEAVAAVTEAIGEAAAFVANLGADVTPAQREEVRKVVLPAIIISQVAQAAAAASTIISSRRIK